ncbi:hypothetical protein E2C01_049743 [Portunus trituberculatus]|uniref:Uncharacterized protein n=1 Tax=Portunus trituberculatus TaxID=210409 RepID=A0A5B7GDY4_PORTR|nr:hypothetical protein [Portunus trituberculatus]
MKPLLNIMFLTGNYLGKDLGWFVQRGARTCIHVSFKTNLGATIIALNDVHAATGYIISNMPKWNHCRSKICPEVSC